MALIKCATNVATHLTKEMNLVNENEMMKFVPQQHWLLACI